MIRRRTRLRGALAGAVVGGVMLSFLPASPAAAAAAPGFFTTSTCTSDSQYSTTGHMRDFPPTETIGLLVVYYRNPGNEVYDGIFTTTDATGASDSGPDPFRETQPFQLGILFYRDRDNNRAYTKGDDVLANLLTTIDQPCSGAVAQPK